MEPLWRGIFWGAGVALVYATFGFALLVAAYGFVRKRKVDQKPVTPRISLIVAARNEERQIRAKIENSLALDYPAEALEILIGSDGSEDATEAHVRSYDDPRVRLLTFPRRGKIHVLNDCVVQARGELLVFSDANTHLDPQALRRLARNFADPTVGGVCGNQLYRKRGGSESTGAGERLYWSYDKWLKRQESRSGSIVSADGALYAVRRALYEPPSTQAATDDFMISTAVVARGRRLVYEPEALAWEPETARAAQEFRRKVRIIVRGLCGVVARRALLNPFRYGFYAVVLFSHKVLRRLVPLFLIALFTSSAALAQGSGSFRAILGLQIVFYALAVLGAITRAQRAGRWKLLYAPFHYCLLNGAALVALLQLARGVRIERWEPERGGAAG